MRKEASWQDVEKAYRAALDKCPDWLEVYEELAGYLESRGKELEALQALKDGGEPLFRKRVILYYHAGKIAYENQLYDEAEEYLGKYISSNHHNKNILRSAKEYFAHSVFASNAIKHPVDIELTPLSSSINTPQSEYLPVLTADENVMVFTRRIGHEEDVFYAQKENNDWSKAQTLNLGRLPYRKGAFNLSPDGRMIVFAMADHPECRGSFDLFFMKREGNTWKGPFSLGDEVNTPGWESQPCIGPDNRSLYFAADRKGGEGGKDIWLTRYTDRGEWTEPVNLGGEINTRMDESSPNMHRDGKTFYFRSTGHPGFGAFDLFLSRLKGDTTWTQPINLGFPINTHGHEGSIFVLMDGKTAYYSTDRSEIAGGNAYQGEIDIYEITLPENLRANIATYIEAIVLDSKTGMPLKAKIQLYDYDSEWVVFSGLTSNDGNFQSCVQKGASYAMITSCPGYIMQTDRFEISKEGDLHEPFIVTVLLDPLPAQEEKTNPVVLKNVHFEFGEDVLLPGSFPELNTLVSLLKEHPEYEVNLSGHTDNVGDSTFNEVLSTERAARVAKYLIDHGIKESRITSDGYGATRPLFANDSEENRALNRRVEFQLRIP